MTTDELIKRIAQLQDASEKRTDPFITQYISKEHFIFVDSHVITGEERAQLRTIITKWFDEVETKRITEVKKKIDSLKSLLKVKL